MVLDKIIQCLKARGALTYRQIAEETGAACPTVRRCLSDLRYCGMVDKCGEGRNILWFHTPAPVKYVYPGETTMEQLAVSNRFFIAKRSISERANGSESRLRNPEATADRRSCLS
jgi:hypothetical protein